METPEKVMPTIQCGVTSIIHTNNIDCKCVRGKGPNRPHITTLYNARFEVSLYTGSIRKCISMIQKAWKIQIIQSSEPVSAEGIKFTKVPFLDFPENGLAEGIRNMLMEPSRIITAVPTD